MKIKYGIPGNNIDVTNICLTSPKLFHNNIITIPSGDENRAHHFTDPVPYVVKQIFIQTTDNNNDGDNDSEIYFDQHHLIKINIHNNAVDVKVVDVNEENKMVEMKLLTKIGRSEQAIILLSTRYFSDRIIDDELFNKLFPYSSSEQ